MVYRPEDVVGEIRRKNRSGIINLFWVAVFEDDRDEFAEGVKKAAEGGDRALVPWVVRNAGFDDPNAMMLDVCANLELAKEEILSAWAEAREKEAVDIVLLTRRDLDLPFTASPVMIPGWFPVSAGTVVAAGVEDITWSVSVDIGHEASSTAELSRLLFELDEVLIARLQVVAHEEPQRLQSLWARCFGEDDPTNELVAMSGRLASVRNPARYRPQARKGTTVVGVLWYCVNTTAPDSLGKTARSLDQALGFNLHQDEPLLGVLSRMTNPILDDSMRSMFYLLVAMRSACQFVTAAAHADGYGRFPVMLLKGVSLDLRRFIDAVVAALART